MASLATQQQERNKTMNNTNGNATAAVKNGKLVITVPLITPRLSSTGKSRIVATTSGFVVTDAKVKGQHVTIAVNAIIGK